MKSWRKYLDPKALSRITRLELKARLIVEGYISGLHRSPYHGFSVEFAQHREYAPGDDIRHIDWKVFGRSDRFYVKQYEEETNMRVYLLLDVSESMQYGPPDGMDKLTYARHAAAAISYLALKQKDSVGLALFDQAIRAYVPPSAAQGQLPLVVRALEGAPTAGRTDIRQAMTEMLSSISGKSLIILISDGFDNLEALQAGLRLLSHRGHEVIFFHVLASDERTFPFTRMTLFDGMEQAGDALVDPVSIRKAYLAEIEQFTTDLKKRCRRNKADYVLMDTAQPFDIPLATFLSARQRSRAR